VHALGTGQAVALAVAQGLSPTGSMLSSFSASSTSSAASSPTYDSGSSSVGSSSIYDIQVPAESVAAMVEQR